MVMKSGNTSQLVNPPKTVAKRVGSHCFHKSAVHNEIQNVMSCIVNIANYVPCLKYHTCSLSQKKNHVSFDKN